MTVLGPAGVAVTLWLAIGQRWRLTAIWCVLYGTGLGIVVLTKIAFLGWGIGSASLEFGGFSGHSMRAAAVIPVACYIALHGARPSVRRGGVYAGVLFAVLISISRVVLRAHSPAEAITGTMLGLLVAGAFIWQAREVHAFVLSRPLVLASLCMLAFTPHVETVPTEKLLTEAALYLSGHEQPHTRVEWPGWQARQIARAAEPDAQQELTN